MAQWLSTERFGDGSSGAYTTTGSLTDSSRTGFSNTTITGTTGTTSATIGAAGNFANGDIVLIHQSRHATTAGTWELNKIASGGGTTSLTLSYALGATYSAGAQIYRLHQYSGVTIDTGHTLTGTAWDGSKGGIVAFLCNGTTTVTGTITVTGKGFTPGANSGGDNGWAKQGEGTIGTGANSGSANGNGGGGGYKVGGGGFGGGGGGGHATTGVAGGSSGAATGGTGGASAGNAGLTVMVFGGGGGGPATYDNSGSGGYGGGIVILISKTITVTGSIVTAGTNGTSPNGAGACVGGGGAGGAILFKGQVVTLGSTLATAAGGSGGQDSDGTEGGTTSAGRIHADYSTSISGTTTPTLDSTLDTSLADSSGASGIRGYFEV